MKVVAFGASTHKTSINKALATYVAGLIDGAEVKVLDINDYELPLYTQDREEELGSPEQAKQFLADIASADALVISFAEHNGHYPAAYKSLFDWASRTNREVYAHKPAVYLSTSPGPGGAKSVLGAAVASAEFFAGNVRASVSVPNFYDVFDVEAGKVTDDAVNAELKEAVAKLTA